MPGINLVLLHLGTTRRAVVSPDEVYYLEADGDDTLVRRRNRELLRDLRKLGELSPIFAPFGFQRIHNAWMVNLNRVSEIRRRKKGADWEVVMEPPVNRVLPVSRGRLEDLFAIFAAGESRGR